MLTPAEENKLLDIETACQLLVQKCRELRLTAAAPSSGKASKKKTKRQIFKEGLQDYFEKKTQKLIQQSQK